MQLLLWLWLKLLIWLACAAGAGVELDLLLSVQLLGQILLALADELDCSLFL